MSSLNGCKRLRQPIDKSPIFRPHAALTSYSSDMLVNATCANRWDYKETMKKTPFLDNREKLIVNSVGFVIYDNFPVSEGHCLIIPHRVYSDYFDSTLEEMSALNQLVCETKQFLDDKYHPDGYNVGINCGSAAGQTIAHMHIHLIPRYKNDVEDPRGGVRGVIAEKQKY